jgi:hypothetical protein
LTAFCCASEAAFLPLFLTLSVVWATAPETS